MEVLNILLVALPSVLSGAALIVINKSNARAEKKAEERAKREELTLKALNAIFSVNKELVECQLNEKPPNGDLDSAYKYQQDIKHELDDYLRRLAAER